MDSYTFRAHLNGVIIGLRALAGRGLLGSEHAAEVCDYLRYVEELSVTQSRAFSQVLLTLGAEREASDREGGTAG